MKGRKVMYFILPAPYESQYDPNGACASMTVGNSRDSAKLSYSFSSNLDGVRFGFLSFGNLNGNLGDVTNRPYIIAASATSAFYIRASYLSTNGYSSYEPYYATLEGDIYVVRARIYGQPNNVIFTYRSFEGAFSGITLTTESEIFSGLSPSTTKYPISYRLTNCTGGGPDEASVGDTVNVPLMFSPGYGVINPATDAYVTNNGVLVPSTYTNGVLSFTMPDPST